MQPTVFPVSFFDYGDNSVYKQYCVPGVYHLVDPVSGIDVYAGKSIRAAERVWYELFSWNRSEIWYKFYAQHQEREWRLFIAHWVVWIHPHDAQFIDERETTIIQSLEPITNFSKCKPGRISNIKARLEAYKRQRLFRHNGWSMTDLARIEQERASAAKIHDIQRDV
jgi:hypothetical protein